MFLQASYLFADSNIQPCLLDKLRIHDSCGVNNLHGMPGLFGGLLSVLMAGIASSDTYDQFSENTSDKSLTEIFPASENGGKPAGQALSQFLALLVTAGFAIVGGLVTGLLLHVVNKMEGMEREDFYI